MIPPYPFYLDKYIRRYHPSYKGSLIFTLLNIRLTSIDAFLLPPILLGINFPASIIPLNKRSFFRAEPSVNIIPLPSKRIHYLVDIFAIKYRVIHR